MDMVFPPFSFLLSPFTFYLLQFRVDFTDRVPIDSGELVSGTVNQSLFHNSGNEPGNTAGAFTYQLDGLWSKKLFIPGGDMNRRTRTGSVFQYLSDEVVNLLAGERLKINFNGDTLVKGIENRPSQPVLEMRLSDQNKENRRKKVKFEIGKIGVLRNRKV